MSLCLTHTETHQSPRRTQVASASTCSLLTASEWVCFSVCVHETVEPAVSLRLCLCIPFYLSTWICIPQCVRACVRVIVCSCLSPYLWVCEHSSYCLLLSVSNHLLSNSDTNCPDCHGADESFSPHKHKHSNIHTHCVLAKISTGREETSIATHLTPFTF